MPHQAHPRSHARRQVSTRFLFFALLALIVLYPLAHLSQYANYFVYAINWVVLGAAVHRLAHTRQRRTVAILLATIQVAVTVTVIVLPSSSHTLRVFGILEAVTLGGFYVYTIRWILADFLLSKDITKETLYGGLAAYIMFGLVWASAYAALELLVPGSLNVEPFHDVQGGLGLMYFSFVTLTTLGYGDVLPLSNTARSLSVLEAIMGNLYLTVAVASIVSRYHSRSQPQEHDKATSD